MTRVFIDGGHGTTGLEIAQRVAGRREFTLVQLSEDRRKDVEARCDALNSADIVILCLPDGAARDAVALVENTTTRIIDASSAHRVAPGWTYGFPELGFDIANARRVSNPGCYPTGFLALVAPLVKAGLIPADWPLTVNAVSGYSGGGKAMIAEFESGPAPAWRTYALTLAHKHVAEMRTHAGLTVAPIFAPSVVNTLRGMVVDVALPLSVLPRAPSPALLRDCLTDAYPHSAIVNVVTDFAQGDLGVERCADTDRLDLFVFASLDGSQVRLVAALDNLGKGAAGAAVQSLNLIAGLRESEGLRL